MKTRTIFTLCILFAAPILWADIELDKKTLTTERTEDTLLINLPFRIDESGPVLGDLTVTLLDAGFNALAKTEKKIVLMGEPHTETVALPIAANTPPTEQCRIRVDLLGHIWLKQFTPAATGQEIHVIGQNRWIAGSRAAVRVIVTRTDNGHPLANAMVQATIFSSTSEAVSTDANGEANLLFTVPPDWRDSQDLTIGVQSPLGKNSLTAQIQIIPGTKIFLSTDKPVYQPGQLIHIRALAAHKSSDVPIANKPVVLEVYDGKGNKVFKNEARTSEFGIVSADFQLADEVNQGDYKILANLDDEVSEKTVQVYEYVLPKFRVEIKTGKKFYLPGEEVKGSVDARYFFGKPLEGAKVTIVANCFDVGFNEFAKAEVVTNGEGHADYQFTIPDRLVGQPQFKGNTIVQMDVRVRDTADHEEQKIHTFHVATDPVQIEAIPESGQLVEGVENEIFLVASTPDGSVVCPKLTVDSRFLTQPVSLMCDENGIASVRITPLSATQAFTPLPPQTMQYLSVSNSAIPHPELPVLSIQANLDGKTITVVKDLQTASPEASLLLRVNRGVYHTGDTMEISALSATTPNESVFLDVIQNDQTIATKTMRLKNGRASLTIPLDNQLSGSLTLNGYILDAKATMIRDTRQVIVLRNDDLRIEITPDQPEYEPGQPAQLRIAVTGKNGEPVRAALGMNLVDESVYSLSEKEPGLAKVFFAIERELLQPKVEIHGYELDKVVRLSAGDYSSNAQLSKALLAKLDTFSGYGLNIDTVKEKEQQANQDIQQIRNVLQNKTLLADPQPQEVAEVLLSLEETPSSVPTTDPWEHPYYLVVDQDNAKRQNIFVVSSGRDGQLKTTDDLRNSIYNQPISASFAASNTTTTNFSTSIAGENRLQEGFHIEMKFNAVAAMPGRAENVRTLRRIQNQPDALSVAAGMGGMGMGMAGVGNQNVQVLDRYGAGMMDRRGIQTGKDDANRAADMKLDKEALASPGNTNSYFYFQEKPTTQYHIMTSYGPDEPRSETIDEKGVPTEAVPDLSLVQTPSNAPTGPLVVNGQVDKEQLRIAMEPLPDAEQQLKDLQKESVAMQQEIHSIASAPQPPKSVRVRRYFPETLFYTPEMITDDNGLLALNLPMADSITTWRMSAMANAKSGALGDATAAVKVFKPFFIDLDLPVALIQNDEVTIPVAVYNYLPETQDVKIELDHSPWFQLLEGSYDRTLSIAASEVSSVTYRIRAQELGKQPITVFAWGSKDNDAIGREIEVRPNGDAQFATYNGRLTQSVKQTITFPAGRVPGADKLFVKIYPGLFSQVVEGLDAILQMPYGCFEQTSSTTYPNVMALQYMQKTGKITPEIEMKAKEYINLGYQRLLTFEIDNGGFQVFGQPPATRILSAYGLMEFSDMSKVYPVDELVLQRTTRWLLDQMNSDGTWSPDENYAHAEMWKSIQDNPLLSTAYIALALAKMNAGDQMEKSTAYLLQHADDAKDAYTLSILCNALQALDPRNEVTKRSVQRLVDRGILEGDLMHWSAEASMSFARGDGASVEATAWAALALLNDERFPKETGKTLNWIIQQKDPNGTWGTTHGTVLALQALVTALGKQTEDVNATVRVHVNGQEAARLSITPENSDLFRQLDLSKQIQQEVNTVEIDLEGEGSLLYQIVGKYFVPWNSKKKPQDEPFHIEVAYDRSELRRNDTVSCQITATNRRPARAEMVMIDIGVPPGFRVETPALDDYVENKTIAKYSQTPRQLLIYLESMDANAVLRLAVPMKATLPMTAKAPESAIYEYYNPEQKEVSPPQELEVK